MQVPSSNTSDAFERWAKDIAASTDLMLEEKIYQGTYYTADFVRDVIYSGTWEGKPAVLKMYDDPRLSDEPFALDAFNRKNTSSALRAPALYTYLVETAKRGWYIMERLPQEGSFFKSPLSTEEKLIFTNLYLEYRRNVSKTPTRPLTLAEALPASEYHRLRIAQWFRLANEKEEERKAKGQQPLLHHEEFLPRYLRVIAAIEAEFSGRNMVWCHGHFKPQELYRTKETCYLTDFAHMKMYPEGYELAFIVWADRLMTDWQMPYAQWKEGIDEWTALFSSQRDAFGFERFDDLWRASLLERSIGTVLADVTASDRPRDEQEGRIAHLYRFIDELLGG